MKRWEHALRSIAERPDDSTIPSGWRRSACKDGRGWWRATHQTRGDRLLWERLLERSIIPKGKSSGWRLNLTGPQITMVVECIRAITQRLVDPDRCKGDAGAVLALWRGLGSYDPVEFLGHVRSVAIAARTGTHGLFALDIRNQGRSGPDRSRSVATLCRIGKFNERLAVAQSMAGSTAGNPGYLHHEDDEDEEAPIIE